MAELISGATGNGDYSVFPHNKIKTVDGDAEILIDPKCAKLIYNCESLMYKEGTNKIDVPSFHQIKSDKMLKFLSHPFDAASYLVDFYFPILPDKN